MEATMYEMDFAALVKWQEKVGATTLIPNIARKVGRYAGCYPEVWVRNDSGIIKVTIEFPTDFIYAAYFWHEFWRCIPGIDQKPWHYVNQVSEPRNNPTILILTPALIEAPDEEVDCGNVFWRKG